MTTLDKAGPKVHSAEIVHHGEKLILPETMGIPVAIDLLQRRMAYLEEKTTFSEKFDVFPWDGANALDEVLRRRYGWAPAVATPGLFGDTPPKLVSIEVGPNKVKQVVWGRFQLPHVKGFLQTGVDRKGNRLVFSLHAEIIRKDEETVRQLFNELREYLKTGSIYQGKAVKIRFKQDNGEPLPMPEPKFIDTDLINDELLLFSDSVRNAVETNLFTPILRVQDCLKNGIAIKRGVLLGGTFGTGKTLAASVASKHAVKVGVTYVYVPRADELADAIEFAKQYQDPACVIFCEDIDRVLDGNRSVAMDDILNIVDGIDTKNSRIIVVLTTNNLEGINAAMLRPGRLDAVIEVTTPDAKTVERLLRAYGGAAVPKDADLTKAGERLAGHIPAVIAEVVKRAKLAELRRLPPGADVRELSGDSLLEAAETMGMQLDLLKRMTEKPVPKPPIDSTLRNLVAEVTKESLQPLM